MRAPSAGRVEAPPDRGLVGEPLDHRLVELVERTAPSTPSAAGAASGPRRMPSQSSRSTSFGRQASVVAPVAADHEPRAGLGEAGQVVEVAAVAIRVIVVAVALPLGRGRHDGDAAAGGAATAAMRARRAANGEDGVPHRSTVAAGGRRIVAAGASTPQRGTHHAIPTPRPERPQGQRALARLVGHVPQPGRHRRGARDAGRGDGRRRQLLRQRRGLRQAARARS